VASVPRARTWAIILVWSVWVTITSLTIALAQASDGDADGGDGDELSALTLLLGVAAVAMIGWIAYRQDRGEAGGALGQVLTLNAVAVT